MALIGNIVDLERLAWPTLSLIFSFVVWLCLIVSLTTPGWITLNLFRNFNGTNVTIPSGNITIGLIRTTEEIDTEYGVLGDTFYTYSHYKDTLDLIPVAMAISFCVLAIIACTAAMAFEFRNAYRIVKNIWLGPSSMYLVTLITAAFLTTACASFTEFYLNMDTSAILNISRHDELTFNDYTVKREIFYSPILLFIATFISIFPILFSWRLTVLLPIFYDIDVLDKMKVNFQRQGGRSFILMDRGNVEVNADDDDGDDDGDDDDDYDSQEEGSGSSYEQEVEIGNESLIDMLATFHGEKT